MASINRERFTVVLTSRVLDLAGIHNFRDYGGYAVSGGGRLRQGWLWRSGQHHGASDADLAQVAALGLVAVYDLRSDSERRSHPCRRPAGFAAAIHLTPEEEPGGGPPPAANPAETAMANPAEAAAAKAERPRRSPAETRASLARAYATFPFRPGLIAAMRNYLAGLARYDGPSLVNCMAGKDRTGLAVAMAQRALGMHRDDIMADYLLTNTAGDIEARIASGGATIASRGTPMAPEVLRVIMGVEPEYLDNAFAAAAETYGSEEAYLEHALGADTKLREAMRAKLVEG
jgi:protein tyrosine/serine phosphatase